MKPEQVTMTLTFSPLLLLAQNIHPSLTHWLTHTLDSAHSLTVDYKALP